MPASTVIDEMDSNETVSDSVSSSSAKSTRSSTRDVRCKICNDDNCSLRYGTIVCDGCAEFFKRSIRRKYHYECLGENKGCCVFDKSQENNCRACRLEKCFKSGMNKNAVLKEKSLHYWIFRRHIAMYSDALRADPELRELIMKSPLQTRFPGWPIAIDGIKKSVSPKKSFLPLFRSGVTQINMGDRELVSFSQKALSLEDMKDIATLHLVKNVYWIKNVDSFKKLPMADQLQLLEDSWKNFIILAFAQYIMPMNFAQLPIKCEAQNKKDTRDIDIAFLTREMYVFQDVLNNLFHQRIDSNEYEHMRAIILFNNGECSSTEVVGKSNNNNGCLKESNSGNSHSLIESDCVAALHKQSCADLMSYTSLIHPGQPTRFQTLMNIMSSMNSVSSLVVEEVFFRKTMVNSSTIAFIKDIYRPLKSEE